MNKCDINSNTLRQIGTLTAEVLEPYLNDEESLSTLRQNMGKLFDTISKQYKLTDISSIVDAIYNTAEEYAIVEVDPGFFNKNNITNSLTAVSSGLQVDINEASTEHITDSEVIQSRLEANKEFLDNAFSLAKEVKAYMVQQANQNLFDCMFINRGSVENIKLGIVRNTTDLNRNIREYQEVLLRRITNYLKWVSETYPNEFDDKTKQLIDNPQLYKEVNGEIVNTGILEALNSEINKFLSPIRFLSTADLRDMYNTANDTTATPDERARAKRKLDAYNANLLLKHFDTYLSITLGKAIQIKDFNRKTGKNKYQISGKTASLATTWRVSENIDVEAEADAITKMAINTTPLYRWQEPETPVSNQFLHFSDFEHTIAKLKDLSYNETVMGIVFDKDYIDNNQSFWDSLSKETQDFIAGKRLSTVINLIRRNPRQYMHSIFEIFSSQDFYDKYQGTLFTKSQFTQDELDKLYSLAIGIFNLKPVGEDKKSLNFLVQDDADTDFYAYITQTADSIFKVNYVQYYKDNDGIIQVRTLIDQGINNIRRQVEQTINTVNSGRLIKDWKQFKDDLHLIKPLSDKLKIQYDIPDTDIRVTVTASSGAVQFTSKSDPSKTINNFDELWQLDEVKDYLDKVLRLGLKNSIDLQNALQIEAGNFNDLCKDLLSFAGRVTLNQYVSNEIIKGMNNDERDSTLQSIYGDIPAYNYTLGELGLVHNLDVPTLQNIANAKANVQGITIASQVKDGEGNGQSNQTLSRLLGSLQSQFELQERQPWSATKDSLIVSMPGLYEGVYTSKEFHNQNGDNKASTAFSVSEMSYAGLVHDFIGGIMDRKDSRVVGNGHVLFLPSVNSDKGTIGRLKINLNKVVEINGQQKAIKELNARELEQLISDELGTIYINMFKAVSEDWNTLTDYIRSKGFSSIPNLSNGLLDNFQEFNNWWREIASAVDPETGESIGERFQKNFGKSPVDFIKTVTLEYNKIHRLNPLSIIDQVHYKAVKENGIKVLKSNQVFIAQIARFKPEFLQGIDPNFNLEQFPSSRQFFNLKKVDVLKGLIKSNFRINTTGTTQKELLHIRERYPKWINKSGDVVLARYQVLGPDGNIAESVNITSKRDLIKLAQKYNIQSTNANTIIDNLQDEVSGFQLNPFIEQYNYLDYLFTQEFMCATVGSFIAHPEKSGSNNVLEQEAASFQAQHKRNVSFTAAMHAFQLNLLNGIPEQYNLAVIDDIIDEQGTILGLNNKIKPFDGATFVNPFVVILENNSLGGARAGITKKQFVHFKNERTGTGGIIKTAGFGLTNDWIRNSPFLETMMRKMTDHVWLNEDGSPAIVDLTMNYKGSKIQYQDFYFKHNGRYFKIDHFESLGNNIYKRTISEVNLDGSPIKTLTSEELQTLGLEEVCEINTNYKLWNFFGGKNSMIKEEGDKFLKLSNTSVSNVVTAMNSIGTRRGKGPIKTQDQLWQPLKQVDVHYLATAGAVKQGAANINSADKYTNEEAYDTQRINMYQAGIQLDKEHHADDSELSLMTQVISACAAKGYTLESTIELYNALRRLTEIGTKDHLEAVQSLFTDGSEQSVANFQNIMMQSIVKALGTDSNVDNFAAIIASNLIRQAKEGKEINFAESLLPLSDNTIHAKVLSTVTSFLTNSGIKQKISGILSVLTPSHNIFQLYGDRKFESFTNPEQELEKMQLQYDSNPVFDSADSTTNISDLELGRTYKITHIIPNSIDFKRDYNGVSLEQAYRKVVYNRLYQDAPPSIKGQITKILNGNSKVSLSDIVNKLTSLYSPEDQQQARKNIIALINAPISKTLTIGVDGKVYSEFEFLQHILGQIGTSQEMLNQILTNSEENIAKELTRYGLQELTPSLISAAAKYSTQNNIPITANTDIEYRLVRTPTEYKNLKQEIQTGKVIKVVEAVYDPTTKTPIGRDLASYNVRFQTSDGQSFQLWDLDSACALFDLNELRNKVDNLIKNYKKALTPEEQVAILQDLNVLVNAFSQNIFGRPQTLRQEKEIKDWLDKTEIRLRRWLQRDLMNLSESTPDLMEQYNVLLQTKPTIQSANTTNIIDINTISNNTASFGVQLANGSKDFWDKVNDWQKTNPQGIVAYRKYGDNPNTFSVGAVNEGWIGNPFSVDAHGANTVQQFYEWIVTGNNFGNSRATEEFRQAVIKKILNTPNNSPILYYTELNRPSHATVIGYLVNHKELLRQPNSTNSKSWYNRYAQWVNIQLGRNDGSKIALEGQLVTVTADNFDKVDQKVSRLLSNMTKVRIGKQLLEVDKNSIKTQAYEVIMPKTFKTNFGLNEFDDLNTIKEDRDFFIKQYFKNRDTKSDIFDDNYTIEFKVSNGDHYYLLKKGNSTRGLTKVDDIQVHTEDGKTYRTDINGNIMYEITPDTEIYRASNGTEVIVSNDLSFYINSLHYDSIKLSESLESTPSVAAEIVKFARKSTNRSAKEFATWAKDFNNNGLQASRALNSISYEDLIKQDATTTVKNLSFNPIIKMGRAKHTSFLKSLDIVAARIPAQSMQSFMPMKVVAYDNPDINTAHVSTMQILLQGSDYDVDAVSLATYDINRNGLLQLWSPYANIESQELMEVSMTLPFPTGIETNFQETNSIVSFGKFISKYSKLFEIQKYYVGNEGEISADKVHIEMPINSVEKILLLKKFLVDIQSLSVPEPQYYQELVTNFFRKVGNDWITVNHIPSLIEEIKKIADRHNLYFDTMPIYNLTKAVNNYTMYSMYKTISDPVNLIEAQTSVDGTTGPLKEEAKNNTDEAESAKTRTPGNFVNKYESITENQIGKEAIGICATGLKSFFGLTQYSNYVLNYGTSEQQSRLLLGPKHNGIVFNSIDNPNNPKKSKVFKTLANIRSKDPNTITNSDVLEALSSVTNDNDAALVLSALLSLATDNAKELTLSKLNAGTKMIGMYIYGITIGMDFRDVAKILMSDVGGVIKNILDNDVFTERDGYSRVKYIFKYFDEGPKNILQKFHITRDSNGTEIKSPLQYLQEEFNKKIDWLKDKSGQPLPFEAALVQLARSSLDLSYKLELIEQLRSLYNNTSKEAVEIYNQAIDFIEDYIQQGHIIGRNEAVYKDIRTLSEGAEEMRRLGSILSLNQGIKTNSERLLNQINLIERAIYDITENQEDLINLQKFVFDEQYRKQCIDKYEEYKHTFNILDVVATIPHFMGYLQTLAISDAEVETSFKFRSIKQLSLPLSKKYNKKEADVIKGLQNFIGDYLRRQWMLSRDDTIVVIPKRNKAFDPKGNLIELTTDTPVRLGTPWGDATFRMWMENEVIPNIKEGKIDPDLNPIEKVYDNEFVKDLGNDLLTNTISRNPSIVYTLPINMLPRIDNERTILNDYMAQFNKLVAYPYKYKVESFDQSGNVIQDKTSIPILDLFTYYAMIAHSWKLGEKSLVPILGDQKYQNSGIIEDFHKFVGSLDQSGESLILGFNVEEEEIYPYIIPFESPYSSYANYIYYKNPNTQKYEIMRKMSGEELDQLSQIDEEYVDSSIIKGYKFQGEGLDTNYFPTGSMQTEQTRTMEWTMENKVIKLGYNIDTGKIDSILVNGNNLDIPELKNVPIIKQNKRKNININLIEAIIKNKLNPCK